MDFSLSDEQRLIQESARKFVLKHYARGRRDGGAGDGAVDAARWAALAEGGFLALGLPEAFGGIGGPEEIALLCEEFGRGPVLEPFVSTVLFAGQIIARAGDEAQKAALLPDIAEGRAILSVAYRDAEEAGVTTARPDGDGYVLSGRKSLVLAAPAADRLIVSAAIAGRPAEATSLFLLAPRREGVTVLPARLVDGSWCGEVTLDGVRLAAADRIGAEGEGAGPLQEGLRYAMLGVCAEISGMAAAALEITADYIGTRTQFGAPLSKLQVLRHRIADMAIDCEMARSSVLKLIASFQDRDQHDPAMTLSLAKVVLDEIAHRVCSQAIQLHGGIGLTEEHGVGRYFARATVIRSLYGSTASHLAAYARRLAAKLDVERAA